MDAIKGFQMACPTGSLIGLVMNLSYRNMIHCRRLVLSIAYLLGASYLSFDLDTIVVIQALMCLTFSRSSCEDYLRLLSDVTNLFLESTWYHYVSARTRFSI